MRVDARPVDRASARRDSRIRPDEPARKPRARREEAGPLLGGVGPVGPVVVVRAHVAARRVVGVDAARGDGAALLAADVGLLGVGGVVGVHAVGADVVVPAAHLDHLVDARALVAGGGVVGDGARGIESLDRAPAWWPPCACRPASPGSSNSSLARDQMATLAWLRSRRTRRSSRSRLAASLPSRRLSSITSMPRRSQASSSSGVGGLWAVR